MTFVHFKPDWALYASGNHALAEGELQFPPRQLWHFSRSSCIPKLPTDDLRKTFFTASLLPFKKCNETDKDPTILFLASWKILEQQQKSILEHHNWKYFLLSPLWYWERNQPQTVQPACNESYLIITFLATLDSIPSLLPDETVT